MLFSFLFVISNNYLRLVVLMICNRKCTMSPVLYDYDLDMKACCDIGRDFVTS